VRGRAAPSGRLRGITCFVHVADQHVMDAQSPGALDDPLTLAGWSRELSANIWQAKGSTAGRPEDRNVILA
jgi:hypothetical protein